MQIYALTSDHRHEEVNVFFEEVDSVRSRCKSEGTLVIEDLNARVGEGRRGNSVKIQGEINGCSSAKVGSKLIWIFFKHDSKYLHIKVESNQLYYYQHKIQGECEVSEEISWSRLWKDV